ncbi:MAG: undecaprenyl-phosphate glucose phosphotransferase [Planctomycetota bacterium]|nr:MAG: undecaprenyl-phosphate glucose phosphotransferase [Planctomycetota bacterium]
MSSPTIHSADSPVALLRRALDALTIGVSLYTSQWLAGQDPSDRSMLAIAVAALLYVLIAESLGVYRSDHARTANTDLTMVLGSWLTTVLGLALLGFFFRQGEHFARSSVLGWIVLTGSLLGLQHMLVRIVLQIMLARGIGTRRCAIAGVNDLGLRLFQSAEASPEFGFKMVGFFDDRTSERWDVQPPSGCPYLGKLQELERRVRSGEIDTVFVVLPMRAEARIRWILNALADTTANVYIVPDFFVFELLHSRWTSLGGLPAVSVFESPLYGVDGWVKRVFDFCAAAIGLVLLAPLMLILALLVKWSSPGPVFFRQRRYGLDGREIWVWKFRTMRTCDNGPIVRQATKDDPRITPIGRILRRTSLDELPQLFNVLEGSMSLVGPRPHATAHNEHYRKLIRGYMLRHKVKPGITGLAQVEGYRGETETLEKMQKRVQYDHQYIQQWSLWLDIKILFRTLWVVWRQETAY